MTKVQQFLRLVSYYCRFVPGFAQIAACAECESAFSKFKLLTTAPVLSNPVLGLECEFILESHASGVGLGVAIAQKQKDGSIHPIAYASCTLDSRERNYGISELETLALV